MRTATTLLVFCVAALLALGMVMLYSASIGMPAEGGRLLTKQLIWCALGLVAAIVATAVDYRHLKKLSILLLGLSIILLGLVLVPGIGEVRGNAGRWLNLGIGLFQPSELAKLCLIIALAHYGERYQRQMSGFWRGLVVPGTVVGIMILLIFKEPDVGTSILLAALAGVILLVAGVRWSYLLPPAIIGAAALGWFLYNNPMRSERIYSWMHLEETKKDKGMQAYQAMVALGYGGITGVGLGEGRQKLGWIPEHHTDFILSVIGEELGLAATLAVVAAFVTLVICGLFIAWNAPDAFGLLLGTGITMWIGLQAFINIGVVTSALPNKGLPLPFISYGGSSLLMMLTSVGILLSIARHAVVGQGVVAQVLQPQENPFSQTS